MLFGLETLVASMLSFLPWLVMLSRHKVLTFAISDALIAFSTVNIYYIVPRERKQEFSLDNPDAGAEASKLARILLWASAAIYGFGSLGALVLGPILLG